MQKIIIIIIEKFKKYRKCPALVQSSFQANLALKITHFWARLVEIAYQGGQIFSDPRNRLPNFAFLRRHFHFLHKKIKHQILKKDQKKTNLLKRVTKKTKTIKIVK